jgi:hypothetical protein
MSGLFRKVTDRLLSYHRRLVHDPLLSVPEFAGRISRTEQIRYGSEARNCQAVADMLLFGVEYVSGAAVEGDVVEFGCMTGRTATVLAAAMASFRLDRKLHLFDSFEGLPDSNSEIDQRSLHVKHGVWAPGTCRGISPAALRAKCTRYLSGDQVLIYEGWFRDTMPRIPTGTRFGLLHVDCDLYQSAIEALDYVFQRRMVAEGAIILFDDWNCNRASNDFGERKAWQEVTAKYRITFSDAGDYGWAGHKFIVHTWQSQ